MNKSNERAAPASTVSTPEFIGRLTCAVIAPDSERDAEITGLITHIDTWQRAVTAQAMAEALEGQLAELSRCGALYQPDAWPDAWHALRDDVLNGVDGLDNNQVNTVLGMLDSYEPTPSVKLANPQQHAQAALSDEQVADVIMHLIHHEHELNWFESEEPFSSDAHERDFLIDLVTKARTILATHQPAPVDPMDWPLPCDVTVGAGTHKMGVPLRALVARMKVLHGMAAAAPLAAAVAQGDPDAAFAQFCDREGYPSDGPFNAALRKAFDAGRAAHPPADSAPVDAEQATRCKWTVKQWYEHVGAWENPQGEVCFGSVMALGAMLKLMAKARHSTRPPTAQGDALSQQAGNERSAFEALCIQNSGASAPLERSSSGAYRLGEIQCQWIGWLARAPLAQRSASPHGERDAALLEKAAQACDQQADGTNGPYRSACLQCANAVRALRDASIVGQPGSSHPARPAPKGTPP